MNITVVEDDNSWITLKDWIWPDTVTTDNYLNFAFCLAEQIINCYL